MEIENTGGGGLSSPPLLPFFLLALQNIACQITNSSSVYLVKLKLMMTDM